jgi:hypothetical protein
MRRGKTGFFTEVDANTYKSGCERFHNIQKKMRTVFARGWAIAGLTPSLGDRGVKDLAGQMVKLAIW